MLLTLSAIILFETKVNDKKLLAKMDSLTTDISDSNNLILSKINKTIAIVTVTAYVPDTFTLPASTRTIKSGQVAVSRDLFSQGWVFGKKIYIESLGIYEINDLMAKDIKKTIDIVMFSNTQAVDFGVKKNLLAALLNY
jgi:3D (Asp-Asp-Asp) domain-containing protein